MMIIFEGPDGGGKDTLRHAVAEHIKTSGTVCVARAWASHLTYARYFKRPLWEDYEQRAGFSLYAKHCIYRTFSITVHCTATEEVLYKRVAKRDGVDPSPDEWIDSKTIDEYFQDTYKLFGMNDNQYVKNTRLLWLNTTIKNENKCALQIIKFADEWLNSEIKRIENEHKKREYRRTTEGNGYPT